MSCYDESCTSTSHANETDDVDLPTTPGDDYCSDALHFRNVVECEGCVLWGLNCTTFWSMSECEEVVGVPSAILSVECLTIYSTDCAKIYETRLWKICGPCINDFNTHCPNTTLIEPPLVALAPKPTPTIESLQAKLTASTSFATRASDNDNDCYSPCAAIMLFLNSASSKTHVHPIAVSAAY